MFSFLDGFSSRRSSKRSSGTGRNNGSNQEVGRSCFSSHMESTDTESTPLGRSAFRSHTGSTQHVGRVSFSSAMGSVNSRRPSLESHDTLTRYCQAYSFEGSNHPFYSDDHYGFVRHHYDTTPEVTQTKLVLPPGHNKDDNQFVIKSLYNRCPVFWGTPKEEFNNWDMIRENFGYTKADTVMSDELTSRIRYALVGPIRVMAHGDLPERQSNMIHFWGVNLESESTADYKTIVAPYINTDNEGVAFYNDELCKAYYARHYEVFNVIIHAALLSLKPGQTGHIQSALIGAGCFLRGVKDSLKSHLLQVQLDAFSAVLKHYTVKFRNTPPLHFKLCIFSPNEFTPELVAGYQSLTSIYNWLSVGIGSADGNVLGNVPYGDDNVVSFVVNAGDAQSFIGNGMKMDPTVEGFAVANAKGFNNQFRNTSFLHNPRFNESLKDQGTWHYM